MSYIRVLLQCLEAEFYSWVAYGEGLASVNSSLVGACFFRVRSARCCTRTVKLNICSLAGSGSALTSGSGAAQRNSTAGAFSDEAVAIATEIAENEV